MGEEWIIRVQGKEYGPADFETLREWRREGRLVRQNPARHVDVDLWTTAAEIPGLFEAVSTVEVRPAESGPRRSLAKIFVQTLRIYRNGFFQFLCLTLLVVLPSLCGQLTGAMIETSSNVNVDLRTATAAAFTLCMLVLSVVLWPIYIAGIQIITAAIAAGRRVSFLATLNEAVKFWPRVAFLCILVYGAFILLMLLALVIMVMLAGGGSSLLAIFVALGLLVLQVWMFGRLFINVLFWQQAAVLEGADAIESLRRSKQLARSGRNLPWFQRPWWRGALIASTWVAFLLALEAGPTWSSFRHSFQMLMSAQDPQALIEALKATPQTHGPDLVTSATALLQSILRPLLGIAFVVLYFDVKADSSDESFRGDGN